ncbi:STAS-like domain-containing protein [Leptolyngbya ectocarpi]|uniref:STAS-like domain-containing protein n=1 Tax=Leptolyngbya ectocarpi TaxID=1202 RepID=UPI001D14BCEF|nr:STAS-like domain-containing protein [Leptolyngbya ectocarpi]
MSSLPTNVLDIWNYGFTEILNNAIEHSNGKKILVKLTKGPKAVEIIIADDGEGIFRKIQRELNLLDERHVVLELSKGKLTTDPINHSGQGIFFSSRLFDDFVILSGNVFFSHHHEKLEDWIMERDAPEEGTFVFMELRNNTARTCKQVFDQYSAPLEEDYGFIKTVVPVRLVQYGNEFLVSRSQAKRLLARVDKFKVVILDFDKIDAIGQAFADEVFRVFLNHHPDIQLHAINANDEVRQMILRAGGKYSLENSVYNGANFSA